MRCLGIAAGLVADRLFGEPPNKFHPVAWFGSGMKRVEASLWADLRKPGTVYAAVGVGAGAAAGLVVRSTAVAVAVSVAGSELRSVARAIAETAASGDLVAARLELPSLVGRDPSELDSSGIAAAVAESLAENAVDAVIAPVFWAVVGGAPGAAAYRAVNTMDAMVGHRSSRYKNFGWAAARLDDVANYVPARIFALLVAAQSPTRAKDILASVRRYAPAHPSPNAGVAETAVATSLGLELGGPLRYGTTVSNRPTLGSGRRPTPADIPSVIKTVNQAELTALGLLLLVWVACRAAP